MRDFLVVGRDRAAVAPGAKIFAGIEAEASRIADSPGHLHPIGSADASAMSLASILDEFEIELGRDFFQLDDLRRQTIQMYRNDCSNCAAFVARQRFQKAAQCRHADVAGRRIDIDEPRPRAGLHDRSRRRDEGHRYGDDFVARTDTERQKCDAECVGAVGNGDDALHAQKFGELPLEAFDLIPTDVGSGGMDRLHLGTDALADFKILRRLDQRI